MPHRHWQSCDRSEGQSQCIAVTKRGKGRLCARVGICTETRTSCEHPVSAKVLWRGGRVLGWTNRPYGPFGFYMSGEKPLPGVCFISESGSAQAA